MLFLGFSLAEEPFRVLKHRQIVVVKHEMRQKQVTFHVLQQVHNVEHKGYCLSLSQSHIVTFGSLCGRH